MSRAYIRYARCKRMALNAEVPACFNTSPSPEFAGLLELSAQPLFIIIIPTIIYNVNEAVEANLRTEKLSTQDCGRNSNRL